MGTYGFEECANLASVTIPSSVTTIGTRAFEHCSDLTDVYVGWTNTLPSLASNIFFGVTLSGVVLHVPAGTESKYNTASVWRDFRIVDPSTAPAYGISIGAFTGGSVSADKSVAIESETVTLTVACDPGYLAISTSVHKDGDGADVVLTEIEPDSKYSFRMPACAVTVTAAFQLTDEAAVEADKTALAWDAIKGGNS